MLISGINTFSLIEFPGEISCIIFTPGCNFRCPFCHNSEYVLAEKLKYCSKYLIPYTAFFNFLLKRKDLLTGVSICGGEPTIHKELPKFCKKIKDMGFKVKLDTNGQNPEMIKFLLKNKLVDYIAMDIKNPIGKFSDIVGVNIDEKPYLETIKLLMNSNIDYEFRTTVIKGVHSLDNIKSIAKYIKGANKYYLQNYRPGDTLDKDFSGSSFSENDLLEFKEIASKYISNVDIRN